MVDTSLTDEELGALLGNTDNSEEPNEAASEDSKQNNSNDDVLSTIIENALPAIKSEFSQKLGEEIAVNFLGIERSRTLSVEGGGPWYVAKGSFATNDVHKQFIVFPNTMAHELAKRVTGVNDIEDTIEHVSGPLKELSDNVIRSIAAGFDEGFLGPIDQFELSNDLGTIEATENFLRAGFSVGENTFFYFLSATILSILNKESNTENTSQNTENMSQKQEVHNNEEEFSSLLSEESKPFEESTQNSSEKESVFSSALLSLGDELLKEDSPVSDVEFPAFDSGSAEKSGSSSEENKRIDMLMDVHVTISVELGSTQRTVEEVLELGRGSILDLNKLAGEPLDIKVNDKLIAKGEVVVIDENFGVRIVEILALSERMKK